MLQHRHMHPAFPTSYDTNYTYESPVARRRIRYRDLPSMEMRARRDDPRPRAVARNDHPARGPHRRLDEEKPTGLELGLGGGGGGCGTGTVGTAGTGARARTCTTKLLPDLFADKPIVRSPRPQSFNREILAQTERMASKLAAGGVDVVAWKRKQDEPSLYSDAATKRMSVRRRWTSTTREASEEAALRGPTAGCRCPAPATTLEARADSVRHRVDKYDARPRVWQRFAREWDLMQPRTPMPAIGRQKADEVSL